MDGLTNFDRVNGLAKVNPYTIVPGVRPVSEYVHRTPASAYNNPSPEGVSTPPWIMYLIIRLMLRQRGTGVKHGSKVLSNLPTAEKKARFIEFTKSFSEAPVSMPAEDINVLLAAVEVATANPDPNSQAFKIVMQECWHNKQGTYPIFVTTPLSIIEKNIKEAWPEFFERLDLYWEASKKTRQKEPRFKQILTDHMGFKSKAEVQEPKVLILSWFLEHFRLWDRKYRIFVCDDGSDFENPPTEKLKVAYRLMTWVEILAHACAQSWILSPRGFDLPGLVVRYHNQPLPRPFVGGNRTFDQAAAIFLPSYSELERTPLESWYQRAVRTMNGDKKGGGYNAVASVAQTTSIEYNHMCGVNVPNPFRSLTFRPGWSVGAVLKTGDLDTAFHPDSEPSGGYVDDGRMFIHEWEKGVEARPGSDGLHSLFSDFYLHIQPEIVRFRKRAQYSWSPTLTQQSAGFVTGQIAMCLGSLSTELAKSRNVHRDFWESDNHVNRPTFPKYLDFGDNIPLEYELKDGVKTYSFPSLREFCALQRIYIPYVSLVPNAADRTPEQSPECTATLALHDSLGLYKQLDEKRGKVILVVICKDGKDPVKGIHHTAEEWCGRLQLELKLEAEKLNRRYEDYRELIKWHKDGYDPNRVEPMNLVQGDASMWHV